MSSYTIIIAKVIESVCQHVEVNVKLTKVINN